MTNHPTYLGLLDDIIANPGDDTPRLIFADWLDENGQEERAEFIRVQCRLINCDFPTDRISLSKRMYNLLSRWCVDWVPSFSRREISGVARAARPAAEIPCEVDVHYFDGRIVTFRRGFVSEIRCPLATWLEHGPAIIGQHPVEVVTAADCEPFYSGQGKQEETNFIIHPGFYVWVKMIRFHSDNEYPRLPWEIPPELWGEELDGSFDEVEDALSALSKVLIRKAMEKKDA